MISRSLLAAFLATLSLASASSDTKQQVLFPQCPAEGACGDDSDFADIKAELSWALSEGAEIILPKDEQFAGDVVRWSKYSSPSFQAVVQVASEQDVQAVVSRTLVTFSKGVQRN
jgi:hypothetical protein